MNCKKNISVEFDFTIQLETYNVDWNFYW